MKGRVALITGAGRGIGLAVAKELASRGAALALNDVEAERLEAAAAEIPGAVISTHPGDLRDPAFILSLVQAAEARHGRLDLLLNNAGGGVPGVPWGTFAECRLEDFQALFDFNFLSQARVLHAVLPGMLKRGYGKVVCVSSVSAVQGQEAGSAYAAGKAALHGLVASVAKEVAAKGVTVNGVVLGNPPHPSRTPARQVFLDKLTHFGRVGRFEEFARAIAFLLSDDSSYMSGTMMPVDGGWLVPRMVE